MFGKEVKIILSPEAKEVYEYLNKESEKSKTEKSILKAIKTKFDFIKANPHYGDPLAKYLIPKEYSLKYGTRGIYRVELPNFWRMIYSLENGEEKIEIIAFILDIFNHKDYDKKFGYRGT